MTSKNKYYFALLIISILVFALGVHFSQTDGFSILNSILITVGALGFGYGTGEIVQNNLVDRNKKLLKTIENQNNPQRLAFLNNQAKAKVFDLITKIFPIVILVLTIMRENTSSILVLIGLYIIIWIAYLLHLNKLYRKEQRKVE
jgi:hypothetical protein